MNEYEQQAVDFLNKHCIKIDIQRSNTKSATWSPSGYHYIVRLTKSNPRKQITFDFWDSIANMEKDESPNAYDILACISGDSYYTTAKQVIDEFGYEFYPDAERIASFGRKLNKFFAEQEIKDLREIQ